MRITSLTINRWRNLENVHVDIPDDATLICLVGENGTGKSNILELLASCANALGLAPGVQLRRAPFGQDEHDISLTLRLPEWIDLSSQEQQLRQYEGGLPKWDRTLTYSASSRPAQQAGIRAGGIEDPGIAQAVGSLIVNALQQQEEVTHLYIDADRAFNPVAIQDQEIWGLVRQDLRVPSYVRQQAALLTQNMYAEWLKSMLAGAIRAQAEYMRVALAAKEAGNPIPPPENPLERYREALLEVLPHLRFERLDEDQRSLVFDSAGDELRYENLSGGEREIAFLIGQIERFQLRRGLLLLDEPELHLNPELLRTWLTYIRDSMDEGQVWIATHALEAVEAAGLETSLVLERSEDRRVRNVQPLGERPALATLAGAVGSPAFSLARRRFVLVEGARPGRERERFAELLDTAPTDMLLEAGSCSEVMRKVKAIREVAAETEQLRVGGIVDRDLRTDEQANALETDGEIHVLPCHEVENCFLHLDGIGALLQQAGRQPDEAHGLVKEQSDKYAGRWIVDRATMKEGWEDLHGDVREHAREWTWQDIEADVEAKMRELADAEPGVSEATRIRRKAALVEAARLYERYREEPKELWKRCFGKEVLPALAKELGLSGGDALEARLVKLWNEGTVTRPAELDATKTYVESITVV